MNNQQLTIVHFNDAHELLEAEEEPKGGIARFFQALQQTKTENPLILFSGDLLSPSYFSPFFKGEHIIESINKFKIHAACYGNHDFDYELDTVINLKNETNFPWLLSNIKLKKDNTFLGDAEEYLIIDHNNLKIGLIGLVEYEWMSTLYYDQATLDYEDFVLCGERLANFLKIVKQCDLIIALTHMGNPNDLKLAEKVPTLDLILGGHEHVILNKQVNKSLVIKSGSNYRYFHKLTIQKLKQDYNEIINSSNLSQEIQNKNHYQIKNYDIQTYLVSIDSINFKPNNDIQNIINSFKQQIQEKMNQVIGYTKSELETRFSIIRKNESNFGNFIADLLRIHFSADIGFINSGGMRSDSLEKQGNLTIGQFYKTIPYPDEVVVLKITGKQIHELLENSVSRYPNLDGRFPQVSGMKFSFNPKKEQGERVNKENIIINNQNIDYNKVYRLSTQDFLIGREGNTVLNHCEIEEEKLIVHNILFEFFELLENKSFMNFYYSKNPIKNEINQKFVAYKKLIHDFIEENNKRLIVINPITEQRVAILSE